MSVNLLDYYWWIRIEEHGCNCDCHACCLLPWINVSGYFNYPWISSKAIMKRSVRKNASIKPVDWIIRRLPMVPAVFRVAKITADRRQPHHFERRFANITFATLVNKNFVFRDHCHVRSADQWLLRQTWRYTEFDKIFARLMNNTGKFTKNKRLFTQE